MEAILPLWIEWFEIVKVPVLLNVIYRFTAVSVETWTAVFAEVERQSSNSCGITQDLKQPKPCQTQRKLEDPHISQAIFIKQGGESVSCSVVSDSLQPHGLYVAPLSTGFPRPEQWSGLPCPAPEDLPDPGIDPGSPALQADSSPSEPPGKLQQGVTGKKTDSWTNGRALGIRREGHRYLSAKS